MFSDCIEKIQITAEDNEKRELRCGITHYEITYALFDRMGFELFARF